MLVYSATKPGMVTLRSAARTIVPTTSFLIARIAVATLALSQDLDEQLLARTEVVQERRMRDADLLRDRPQRRAFGALVGEDLDGVIEDLLPPGDALRVGARPGRALRIAVRRRGCGDHDGQTSN